VYKTVQLFNMHCLQSSPARLRTYKFLPSTVKVVGTFLEANV